MWETWVQSLSWKDPLEEALSTHISILAWRIPMDRSAWSMGSHRVRNYWMTTKACKLCLWTSFKLLVQLYFRITLVPFSSVAQSCPTLCDTMDWSSQASLSITSSWTFLKFMSIELVLPSNHLILYPLLLLLPSIFLSIRVLYNESILNIRLSKYCNFSFSVCLSNEYSGFPLGWTGFISLQSKGLSRVFSNTTVQKHQFLQT